MRQFQTNDWANLASPRGQFLLAAAIVAVTLAVYLPVLNGRFIWDDAPQVWDNRLVKAPDGLRRFWLTTEAPDYFPLTFTVHWVEWRLWRDHPAGYHVVNVLLHAAGAVLLWRVLRRLKVPGAWLAGVLFAVHPVAVASAAYISEHKNTLSMTLALLSLLAYFTFEERGKRRWYVLALLTFLLALLAKTSVVMLPVVLLLCAWWRHGAIGRRDLLHSAPFFALSLALGLATIWFQNNKAIADAVVHPEGPASRVAGAGWVAWFYLFKGLLPAGLCAFYPYWKVNGSSFLAFVPLFLLAAVLALLWARRKSWGRAPLFALGCFLILLLPVLGFLDMSFMRYSLVADHLQYAAMAAVVAFAAAILAWGASAAGRPGRAGVVAAAACVAILAALSCRHARVYADEEHLWRDNVAENPAAWEAWDSLGEKYLHAGQYEEAILLYDAALRAKPDLPEDYCHRAYAYIRRGLYEFALRDCDEAIKLKPDYAEAYNYRGVAYDCLNRRDLALRNWDEAIKCKPDFAEAYNNRGVAYSRLNRYDLALRDYGEAIRLKPRYAAAYRNRAVTYYSMKEYAKAAADVETFRKLGGRAAPDFLKDLDRARGLAK